MPSRLILSGGRPVISRPRKTTRPAFGAYRPETTLKSVDLPAPFGPMTEKTWPSDTAKPTRLSAARASRRSRRGSAPRGRRSSWRPSRPRGLRPVPPLPEADQPPDAEEPRGHEQHDQHQDAADDDEVPVHERGRLVAEDREERAAEDRAHEGPEPADHHRDDELARQGVLVRG